MSTYVIELNEYISSLNDLAFQFNQLEHLYHTSDITIINNGANEKLVMKLIKELINRDYPVTYKNFEYGMDGNGSFFKIKIKGE